MEYEIKYTIYETVSNKQYFVRMFSSNIFGESENTNVAEVKVFGKYIIGKILVAMWSTIMILWKCVFDLNVFSCLTYQIISLL